MTTLHKRLVVFMVSLLGLFTSCSKEDDTTSPNPNDTTIETVLTDIGFQGYAIVTKNGKDLVRQGFGWANQHTELPQGHNLGYRIGSVTKTLTAAAVVQLKRDGLIQSFDQTLDEFDTEFPNGDHITISQLLAHQSGVPEYQLLAEGAYEQGETLDEGTIYDLIKELILENGLDFTPGSNKEYCNSNYLIAALLVEQVAAMPYHEYVQQKIFNPLGMSGSYKGTDEIDIDTHAQGYLNGSPNSSYPMDIPFGAGDFSSTPSDMENWTNAVKTDWFTEAEKSEIFAKDVPSGYVDFGLGWFTAKEGNITMYWHGGDINGYWSMIGFIPEYDVTMVLLSNRQDDTGTQRNTIIEHLLTKAFN